jgi:tRNA-2-methylthio-N6-dimethylallyladenosine synthase
MAQRLGRALRSDFPAVDYVMGTAARSLFPLLLEALEGGLLFDGSSFEEGVFSFSPSHLEEGAFRSFVPIMHGCNNFCSYCIVPYVRGREVSRDPESLMSEIRLLAERGVREITLLGQNVNSYRRAPRGEVSGGDWDFPRLLSHVARAIKDTPIERVRFLSANPGDFSEETIRVMAENPCFCRHLHLPVQHGSNRILEGMNRRYTRESFLALTKALKEAMPDLSLSTDILVGFPGETGEDLDLTLDLMERVKFLYAYTYHYNPREGTAAFSLPGRVDEGVKRKRLAKVIALQKLHTLQLLQERIGGTEKVLIEGISRKNADELVSRTERDEMAVLPGTADMIGAFAQVKLLSLRGNTFRAKPLE